MVEVTEENRPTNPVKAIRAKCLDCCCGQMAEVKACPKEDCALHPFRLGKNPFRAKVKRELTDEQREALRERIKRAQAAKRKGGADSE